MSANISILEGGNARSFGPVTCLMVQGDNGEYYPWYPESERELDSLSVDENGIYQASKYGVYGWNRVSVNVPQTDRVTGRDPETGEEKTVTVDTDGVIVETVVPVEIRVIEPPTNPYGTYVDGQTITKDGMVVKAYGANGVPYAKLPHGTVPNGEITINPTVAEYDESTDTPAQYESDLDTGAFVQPIPGAHYIKFTASNGAVVEYSGPIMTCTRINGRFDLYFASDSSPITYHWKLTDPRGNVRESDGSFPGHKYTADSMDVYFETDSGIANYASCDGPVIDMQAEPSTADKGTAMWTLVHGQMTKPAGSTQTITVSWPRPGDGKVLETTFDINVGPRGGQGDD